MDNVIRITFPSFSRLQHEKNHLAKAIEKSLFASCLLIFPSLMGLVVLAPSFITVIPKYQKWEPALISLAFFAMNAALSSISTPLTNALNAIGKIKISLYLMIFWTIATWVLTPLGIYLYGFNAFAAVSAIIAGSVVYVVYLTKKQVPFSVKVVMPPFFATVVMGILLIFLSHFLKTSLWSIFTSILLGGAVYLFVMYLLAQEEVRKDILIVKQHLFT